LYEPAHETGEVDLQASAVSPEAERSQVECHNQYHHDKQSQHGPSLLPLVGNLFQWIHWLHADAS
jgi:hypothetical protein